MDNMELLGSGSIRWKGTKDGMFTVKSAYTALKGPLGSHDLMWEKIWKVKVPERCKFLLWKIYHGRLLTNVARVHRGLSTDASCPICNGGMEDLQHVLRDCPVTLDLWKDIVDPRVWNRFKTINFGDWFSWNMGAGRGVKVTDDWRRTFASTCWWVWKRRNNVIFEGKMISNSNIRAAVNTGLQSLMEASKKLSTPQNLGNSIFKASEKWEPPPADWIKVNTDGAYSPATPGCACGGVIRDEQGNFIQAFMFKGYEGDSLTSELWGCFHGLKLSWDLGFRKVMLEVDSTEAIELLKNEVGMMHEDKDLIVSIKQLIASDWNVDILYVRRCFNRPADYLAKSGLSAWPGLHIISQISSGLDRLLLMDKSS